MSSLGELFASEYKNPSDDTKTKIIEIITSNNSSPRKIEDNFKEQTKTKKNTNEKWAVDSLTNHNKKRSAQ